MSTPLTGGVICFNATSSSVSPALGTQTEAELRVTHGKAVTPLQSGVEYGASSEDVPMPLQPSPAVVQCSIEDAPALPVTK